MKGYGFIDSPETSAIYGKDGVEPCCPVFLLGGGKRGVSSVVNRQKCQCQLGLVVFSHQKAITVEAKHGFIEAEIREIFSVFFQKRRKEKHPESCLEWRIDLGFPSRMSLCSRPLSKELLQEMRQEFETKNPTVPFLMVG